MFLYIENVLPYFISDSFSYSWGLAIAAAFFELLALFVSTKIDWVIAQGSSQFLTVFINKELHCIAAIKYYDHAWMQNHFDTFFY